MTDDGMLELETLAELQARIDFGASLHAALADAGLSREQWFTAQERWGDALAESLDGDCSLFVRHELALAEARERLGPRVAPVDSDLEAWLGFERAFQTAKDPVGFVAAAGISMRELGVLHARWSKRMLDPEVAARAAELRASGALAVPTLRREPLVEPPRALRAPLPPQPPGPSAGSFLAPLPGAAAPAPAVPAPAAPAPPPPDRPRLDPPAEAQPTYLRQVASPQAPAFTPASPFTPAAPVASASPRPAAKKPLQGTSLALDLSALPRPALPFATPASHEAPSSPPAGASASPASASPRPAAKTPLQGTSLALDLSALPRAALPFATPIGPPQASAPPAPPRDAAPAASAPPKKLGVMKETSAFDVSALMAAALPFRKDAAPSTPSAPHPSAVAASPPVALQAYAAFVVEAQAQREPLEALLARHGLTHAVVQQAERYYAEAASQDPALLAAWNSACAAHRSRIGLG